MEKKKGPDRAPVPAHVFEAMLRGTLGEEGDLAIWKETLSHWHFSAHQLDQLVSDLKKGDLAATKGGLAFSDEIIAFIEHKVRDQK